MKKPQKYSYKTILRFGKYAGKPLQDVMNFDPHYVMWAYQNIEWFEPEQDVVHVLEALTNNPKLKIMFTD